MKTEKTIVTNTCDKCGQDMERENGLVIEGLSAQISGYDPRGSGGHRVKDLEFCYSCSKALHSALGLDAESVKARWNPKSNETSDHFARQLRTSLKIRGEQNDQ